MINTNTQPYLLLLLAGALLLNSCEQAGENSTNKRSTVATSSNDSAAKAVAVDPGLTLPVLNALFYEDGFAQDLKKQLALTDVQLQKLKAVSSESVADLDEATDGDYLGSARAASQRSQEQLKKILGDEKAAQLAQLVARRYAGGDDIDGLLPSNPMPYLPIRAS